MRDSSPPHAFQMVNVGGNVGLLGQSLPLLQELGGLQVGNIETQDEEEFREARYHFRRFIGDFVQFRP